MFSITYSFTCICHSSHSLSLAHSFSISSHQSAHSSQCLFVILPNSCFQQNITGKTKIKSHILICDLSLRFSSSSSHGRTSSRATINSAPCQQNRNYNSIIDMIFMLTIVDDFNQFVSNIERTNNHTFDLNPIDNDFPFIH